MKYDSITLDRLKAMLNYDPDTGVFTWRQRPFHNSRKKIGDVAGVLKHTGSGSYRYIGIDNHQYLASQLAFFWVHGRWAAGSVGPSNGNPSDLSANNLVEHRTGGFGHGLNTKEGRAAYRKAYWENNPAYKRSFGWKRFYGIDAVEYDRMFSAQNGVCAICEKPETVVVNGKPKYLSVDHDHSDNAIRGLLCHNCNHTLGHALDDPKILRAAADYIDHHRANPSGMVAPGRKDSA